MDQVVGWALSQGRLPLTGHVLQVNGRASFELAQKSWLVGCPVPAAVPAPSSLAADLATQAGTTLVAFSRERGLPAGSHRDVSDPTPPPRRVIMHIAM